MNFYRMCFLFDMPYSSAGYIWSFLKCDYCSQKVALIHVHVMSGFVAYGKLQQASKLYSSFKTKKQTKKPSCSNNSTGKLLRIFAVLLGFKNILLSFWIDGVCCKGITFLENYPLVPPNPSPCFQSLKTMAKKDHKRKHTIQIISLSYLRLTWTQMFQFIVWSGIIYTFNKILLCFVSINTEVW